MGKNALATLADGIWRELKAAPERPTNEDIARAVRGAQLDALEDLVGSYHECNIARWEREGSDAPPTFTSAAIAFCRKQRGILAANATPTVFAPSNTLRAAIEGLLAGAPHSLTAGERAEALGSFAEDAVLDELTTALQPVAVPGDFAVYLRKGGGRASPRFLDLFGNGIAKQLKENARFRDILTACWLADLKAEGFETGEALVRIETQFGGLRRDVAEIRQILREVVDKVTVELRLSQTERTALAADLARIKAEQNGTTGLIGGFLETVVGRHVPPEQFSATLFRIAADWRAAADQIDAITVSRNLLPQLAVLKTEAQAAHRIGRLDVVTAKLAEIRRAESNALDRLEAHKQEIQQEIRLRRTGVAATRRAEAAVARASLAYREAAEHYMAAARAIAPVDARAEWACIVDAASALGQLGEELGDNSALVEAIEIYRNEALPRAPRDQHAEDWATTQNKLGNVLWVLGDREMVTARLEEAATAFRAALEESPRNRMPLLWARTQNNLGNALWALGRRESGLALLEKAVTAFRAALEEMKRDQVPLEWARTQNNLGGALKRLGERVMLLDDEKGTTLLKEAAAACHMALLERTRERAPLQWARTLSNLGGTLSTLGARENSPVLLEESLAAFHSALKEATRDRAPVLWAMIQSNLGSTLSELGSREGSQARLGEAATAFRAALEVRPKDQMPLPWATTQMNLAAVLRTLGEHEHGTTHLEEAVENYNAALVVFLSANAYHEAEICRYNLDMARVLLAQRIVRGV